MKEKIYTCICGKVCTSPAAFNGHKQGCKEHIINKYGSLEAYYEIKNRNNIHPYSPKSNVIRSNITLFLCGGLPMHRASRQSD